MLLLLPRLLLLATVTVASKKLYAPVYVANWTFADMIPKGYDRSVPPFESDGEGRVRPLEVTITVQVTQLTKVNAAEQSFTVDMVYSQRWHDHQLNLPPRGSEVTTIPLGQQWRKRLWVPDVFLANSIRPAMPTMDPLFMDIDVESQTLVSTTRQVATLTCNMNLFHFPLDEQVCPIEFTLLRQPRARVQLRFQESVSSRIEYPGFDMLQSVRKDVEECVSIRGSEYSCIAAKLELFRKFSYYFIRIYSPSFLLVVTSFVGFWVPPQGHSARTALIVTPLLALITQQTMINTEINVSYLVAMHIWMIVSTSLVFLTLVEYACTIIHAHYVEDRKDSRKTLTFQSDSSRLSSLANAFLRTVYGSSVPFEKNPLDRNKVDYAARVLFPSVYLIFLIIYFGVFLVPWISHKGRHESFAALSRDASGGLPFNHTSA